MTAESPHEGRSSYERWIGEAYRMPIIGSRPAPPRGWPLIVGGSIAVWLVILRLAPLPEGWRVVGGVALAVTGIVLTGALLLSAFVVAERVHRALLARPQLGGWRVLIWFGAYIGYLVLGVAVAAVLLLVASG
jgi:hypothetical protein